MVTKRKIAPTSAHGPAKVGKPSKLSTPGATTPKSPGSDPESSEDEAAVAEDISRMENLVDRFSIETYNRNSRAGAFASHAPLSHIFGRRDYSYLRLKPDYQKRPLWVDPENGRIILERFNPLADQAQDFLVTIAEPQSRPAYLHEYSLTSHSLYAAVSFGLTPRDIITTLDRLSKTPLPDSIRRFIEQWTKSYGKVKLVLKNTKYFVESPDPELLQKLLKDPVIGPLRVHVTEGITTSAAPRMAGLVIPGTNNAAGVQQADVTGRGTGAGVGAGTVAVAAALAAGDAIVAADDVLAKLKEDDDDEQEVTHSFEIPDSAVEKVQKRCLDLEYPMLEEYDFRNDEINANLEIDLRPGIQLRPYQEKSLSKMFTNGRAKSGIIVLPCGAGKTLVGITAACTIRKGVIVLCTSSMSVVQWRNEFLKWSNIKPEDITAFTADSKSVLFSGNTGVIVTTYSMVTNTKERAYDSKKMLQFIASREWGLMLLDEVHVVPANVFRKATSHIKTHSKLGLTATLLREDDRIRDLNFLIGPKLFEANWMELSEQGHIAKVQCAEVWCPMPTEFYDEYLKATSRKKQLLYTMNPRKFQACQYLIHYHERRGDKIIVFSDNIYSLDAYARKLGKCFIHGNTAHHERMKVLENFQHNPEVNTLFLSKIGDTSLDLPEATCLIQISSQFGSRRQEAQRLGRILRAKRRNDEGFNAFFYSLVSKDTQEMFYSSKRQAFLVDQGYAFKVITQLANLDQTPGLAFATASERRELLAKVLTQNESSLVEEANDDLFHTVRARSRKKRGAVRRTAGTLGELSGGQDMAYVEQNKSANKTLKKNKDHSSFFKKVGRDRAKIAIER